MVDIMHGENQKEIKLIKMVKFILVGLIMNLETNITD